MKKYLLVFTTIALLFGACSNDEELNLQEETGGTAIEFRSLTDKTTLLRAAITDETNIMSFTVTGWWDKTGGANYGSTNSADGVFLFDGFNIGRGEGDVNNWDYSPKRYWPAAGKGTVDFFAYSPASSRNLSVGLENFKGDAIKYTVPQISETGLQQEDFLLAKSTGLDGGTVDLNFQHALSRVKFFARKTNANITYVIDSVKLINLASTAELDLIDATNNTAGEPFPDKTSLDYSGRTKPLVIWKADNTSVTDYTVDMSGSPVYLKYDATPVYYSILGETGAVMVMPQQTKLAATGTTAPTGGAFAIAVSYKAYIGNFYYAGSATTSKTQYFAVKDPAYGSDEPIAFEIGRQYNFYLTFGEEAGSAITFVVNVGNWSDATTDPIPVPNYATAQYFPDANFRAYLASAAAGFDTNEDGMLSYEELLGITALDIPDATTDLKGIELIPNLIEITINSATLPAIPVLEKITTLTLTSSTGVSDEATTMIANLAGLKKITVPKNGKKYDFSMNTQINDVRISGNGDANTHVNISGNYVFGNVISSDNPVIGTGEINFRANNTYGFHYLYVNKVQIAWTEYGTLKEGDYTAF